MGLKEESEKIRRSIEKIVKETIQKEEKPCLRLYKAKVVTAPNGTTCEVQLVGDSNTMALPYSSMVNNVIQDDFVWVGTIYGSFSNAFVLFPLDFKFTL